MQKVDLTRHEFLLLVCLVRRVGQCVHRHTLMKFVWGPDTAVSASALDVLVSSLRAKIEGKHRSRVIGTVRGTGYFIRNTSLDEATS
jgi:two-component system response regulator QseB